MKLRLLWEILSTRVTVTAAFANLQCEHTFNRADLESLNGDARLVLLVQAFALLARKVHPKCTDEQVVHATNAAAVLLSVLETKVAIARFEWVEA